VVPPASSRVRSFASLASLLGVLLGASCGRGPPNGTTVVTFPGSMLGGEGAVLRTQLQRFMQERPDIRVVQRDTPDAADQRHQLYVQWLNARASQPDILQLDAIWTPEFAAAGWILPLERFQPDTDAFFPVTITANRWQGRLFAMPWFADVGMLYWRTDLMAGPPASLAALEREAGRAKARGVRFGLVWSGARYEGLVTVFLEYLGAYGGQILEGGKVLVNSSAGLQALTTMRDEIYRSGIVPTSVLTWHEEETRFAFQNGDAAFMRNWPYPYPIMTDSAVSRVAGRFAVAPMPPAAASGAPTAALGGAQLALNANSEHPAAAWAVIDYLTRPEQMLERARVTGQFPTRQVLYDDPALAKSLAVPVAQAREIIEHAVPRPVTPVYTELSDILQVYLHRVLTRQADPARGLAAAAAEMQALLNRVGLGERAPLARR